MNAIIRRLTGFHLHSEPRIDSIRIKNSYDLFFFRARSPGDLWLLGKIPEWRERLIDFFTMGQVGNKMLQTLARRSSDQGWFCLHDTHYVEDVFDHLDHRAQLIQMIQRSRFFLAHMAHFLRTNKRGTQKEFGPRFIEGAAGGAVLVGELPIGSTGFESCFDWPGATFNLPATQSEVDALLDELDGDRNRMESISRENTRQCLLRHDWAYRWQDILKLVDLPPDEKLRRRIAALHDLASKIPYQGHGNK